MSDDERDIDIESDVSFVLSKMKLIHTKISTICSDLPLNFHFISFFYGILINRKKTKKNQKKKKKIREN